MAELRDLTKEIGWYELMEPKSRSGAIVSREFDTKTGGQPERLLNVNTPGDHMCPTRGMLLIVLGPTVGSALTNIDIDHRNRPGTGSWAELCSISDTANAAGFYVCEFYKFKRCIRVTFTVTTSHVWVGLALTRSRREPMLDVARAHGGSTELTPTYA